MEIKKEKPYTQMILAKGNSYYFNGINSVGVYLAERREAILIDSGIDESVGKKIEKILASKGYTVVAIINTHRHGDHCGGNSYFLKKNQKIKIYATSEEKIFINNPHLATNCFCCGAEPFTELKKSKQIQANPSKVTYPIWPYQDQTIDINGVKFDIITLPGHTSQMIGIKTPDNILYCGDALFSGNTFEKHGVLFYTNISQTLASFEKIKTIENDSCVLYHGGLEKDITLIAQKHKEKIIATENKIYELIKEAPLSIDELTQKMMQEFNVSNNVMSYTLTKTCVYAYIEHLQLNKRVTLTVNNGLLRACSSQSKSEFENITSPEKIPTEIDPQILPKNTISWLETNVGGFWNVAGNGKKYCGFFENREQLTEGKNKLLHKLEEFEIKNKKEIEFDTVRISKESLTKLLK